MKEYECINKTTKVCCKLLVLYGLLNITLSCLNNNPKIKDANNSDKILKIDSLLKINKRDSVRERIAFETLQFGSSEKEFNKHYPNKYIYLNGLKCSINGLFYKDSLYQLIINYLYQTPNFESLDDCYELSRYTGEGSKPPYKWKKDDTNYEKRNTERSIAKGNFRDSLDRVNRVFRELIILNYGPPTTNGSIWTIGKKEIEVNYKPGILISYKPIIDQKRLKEQIKSKKIDKSDFLEFVKESKRF